MSAGAVFLLGVLAVVCALRLRIYARWMRVPPHRCDRVEFRDDGQRLAVSVDRNGVDLPAGVQLGGRTVVMKLSVESSILGRIFDPYIEIDAGSSTYRQYFERGAVGQRHLNLSPLFSDERLAPVRRVNLRGKSIRWSAVGTVHVHEFPALRDARILVLAPHPDDAEIAAFGMYARRDSWVATVTAGEKSIGRCPPDVPAADRARLTAALRVAKSLAVPAMGSVPAERIVNLVFPDGALGDMHRQPERAFPLGCEGSLRRLELRAQNHVAEFRGDSGCTWHSLVAELRTLLASIRPNIVICPHPLVDVHSDHLFTTVALAHALRMAAIPPPRMFLYVVHGRGAPTYPFGPADSIHCFPPGGMDDPIADSLYSHPLDPELRRGKARAVEAMQWQYPPDAARRSGWHSPAALRRILAALRRGTAAAVTGLGFEPTDHLRRAPRPNEIYYLASAATLEKMIARTAAMKLF